MYMFAKVRECDFTDTKYAESVDGFAILVAGATGRVCVVMEGGPEELARLQANGTTIYTYEEARKIVEDDPQRYPDF